MYNELRLDHILKTLRTLQSRIEERFPGSGLGRVAAELCRVAEESEEVLERLRRPNWLVRGAVIFTVTIIVALVAALPMFFRNLSLDVNGIGALLQAVESAAQDLIFLAIAIYFLMNLETQLKRRTSLRALHRLRSIVHIVDMHQLTKDPDHLLAPGVTTTPSSPERRFSRFEMSRYLDYCAELLSLSSKLAALHVQYVNDPVVLDAVNDIEVLASNLSNKMWQKIVILDANGRELV